MCSNMTAKLGPIVAITIFNLLGGIYGAQYFGKFIGKLSELHHAVSGEVYAVDGRTLFLKDFTYDGQGPTAYFYASTHKNPDKTGFRLRDENGRPDILRRYRKEGITLTLPEGKTLNSIKVFYVWCEEFQVNFGDVKIPRNFDYPRPQKIQPLKGVHAISSDNIVIVDAQTLLIPNLSFDGEAPDAKFWVGRGPRPSPQGIRVPDENGKELPLRRYDRKTVVLTLPGDLTVFDIGHFGIWCEAFTVDFGHVQIPQDLNVPPSLKMLGVSPQSKLNCEVLHDDLAFEVRWAVAGDSIVLQLVAKLDNREYMSFGVSGDDSKTEMIGGDPVVAWVDKTTLKGFAEDYYLASKSQCSGPTGSCPDNRLSENTNNIRLLNAAMVNGYSIVTYQRPLKPSDEYDRQIHTNKSQAIIWAIGPLNQRDEVSFHSQYTKGDKFIDFGRVAKWNCPMPENEQPSMVPVKQVSRKEIEVTSTVTPPPRSRNSERRRVSNRGSNKESQDSNRGSNKQSQEVIDSDKSASRSRQTERRGGTARRGAAGNSIPTPAPVSKRDPWYIPPIECDEPDDGVFYAQMGPTGGKRGYPAITGHVGWGISWYINGLLIPEVNVVRGQTYTFVVEGGSDPDIPAKYHPFYITDDPIGGFEYKTEEEKKNVTIFAGATTGKDRSVHPTGTGRLCHWTHQGDKDADDFDSFGAYQRTLELQCDRGEPGFIQWTPDKNTPDTVYYQCFTHRYLGWKINVHDSCDAKTAASEPKAVIVPAADLEESPSTILETRVKPNDIEDEDKNKSTISEKSTVPPLTQLPLNEPILIQPQQNFLNPPLYHGALYTFQPYIFELPSFKSNPLVGEDIKQTLSSTTENLPKAVMNDEIIMPPPIKLSRPFKPNKHPLTKFPPRPMRYPPNFKKTIYRSKINLQRPHYAVMKTPQQVSTEKDPEIQTASSVLLSVQAEGANYHNLKPAKNTGFHPESIVMEGGFKPIISKELQRRKSELAPKFLKRSPYIKKIIIKRPRNLEDEELVPAAAERVETYYLPPSGQVPKIPQVGRQRSNIDLEEPTLDLESPPDVVVTYDGRRVSGASLTARIADRSSVLDQRASKAAELIKARPQFVPFKGPLPPLNPDVINRKVPQQIGSINRDLDAPRQGGPTKLSLVRQLVAERDARRKREAHHTPEHTAQQKTGNGTVRGDASVITGSICMMASVVVALSYL